MFTKLFLPFIFFSLFIISPECAAQQDSIIYEEVIDTVIIRKDPVIIKQEIVVFEEKQAGLFAVEVFFLPLYYISYYNACESCKNYLDKLKLASSPALSFSGGMQVSFLKSRLYGSMGIGYTSIKENFTFADTLMSVAGKNSYNYLGLNFLAGYVILQKKINVLAYAGAGINKLLSFKGFTLSRSDTSLTDLKKEKPLADYSQRFISGLKIGYKLTERLNLSGGPEYSLDLRSVVRRDHYYVLQRNMFGLKLSLLYFL